MVQLGNFIWLAGVFDTAAPVCEPTGTIQPSMFNPVGVPGETILSITWLLFVISGGIAIVVLSLIAYAVLRCRRAEGDDLEPPQVYGSNPIELAWTVIPLLIVFLLFMVSARGIFELERTTPPEGALEVTVTGHRWWWEFDYGELGVVTAGELHVPIDE
ncbi:MAG: cytochrome C oxidase subunit II, partial [Planctomycetaceae bacterium]|nr:cytochrome C oxidase subunit II [Planctomycetaceae bacterium]